MSSFEEVLAQYEKQKEQTQLSVLIEIAAQLKRIAASMEKNNEEITKILNKDDEVIDCDLPF